MTLTELQIAHVRSLEDAQGRLTPDQVVADARLKRSPLHGLFEWDKDKAAMMHWIDTARAVIGAVRIVVTTEVVAVKRPIYVRDPDATGQGYRSAMSLRNDPEAARRSLIYTLEVAAGHIRRAIELAEPLGLSDDIDALLLQVLNLQHRTAEAA